MIDKKITWALIFAIVIESAGVFAWAGSTAERLDEVELRVASLSDAAVRLARVEVVVERGLGDAESPGDVAQADVLDAALNNQGARGREDARAGVRGSRHLDSVRVDLPASKP